MITVWAVLNGDKYDEREVFILRDQVARHLRQSHRFQCLADRPIKGMNCVIPEESWPGWWSKLLLFRYSTGFNLYLDLDCVVVGSLDGLVSRSLSMPANWGQSGHGGCQSSVMAWGVPYRLLPDGFDADLLDAPTEGNCGLYMGLWGDQGYLTKLYGDPGAGRIHAMQGIYSYKYHCQEGAPPADASVVCFHGDPKPDQVTDSWAIQSRSTRIPALHTS